MPAYLTKKTYCEPEVGSNSQEASIYSPFHGDKNGAVMQQRKDMKSWAHS